MCFHIAPDGQLLPAGAEYIHDTWPEFQQLTLDVYLCNYLQDNTQKVKDITNAYIAYFEAKVLKDFEINR